MMNKLLTIPVLALTFALGSSLQAAVIADYTFTGDSLASSDTATDSMAGLMADGGGFLSPSPDFFNLTGGSGFDPFYGSITDDTPFSSEADAQDNGQYFTFTVTATSGTLNLDSLTYDAVFNNGHPAVDAGWAIYSDVDSFTTPLQSFFLETDDTPGGEGYFGQTVDLSGAQFQGLAEITFQLVVYDNSTSGSRQIGIDNIVLNDATAIPEPGTFALAGALGGLLLLRRRRP